MSDDREIELVDAIHGMVLQYCGDIEAPDKIIDDDVSALEVALDILQDYGLVEYRVPPPLPMGWALRPMEHLRFPAGYYFTDRQPKDSVKLVVRGDEPPPGLFDGVAIDIEGKPLPKSKLRIVVGISLSRLGMWILDRGPRRIKAGVEPDEPWPRS